MPDSNPPQAKQSAKVTSVTGAAGAMGIAVFLSRILGLVREQVFAHMFGAGLAMDAFNIAFRIPNLLRDLFAEGAMSAALVPTFITVRKREGDRRAWRIAGLVFRVLAVAMVLLTLIGIFFADQLVGLYASAFREIPGKFELTVLLTRIIFPFFPLVVLAAAFMGILNSCGKYFIPAFASALFNLGSIVTGVACALVFGAAGIQPILGMAVGVVAGGIVQTTSQFPLLRRVGYLFPARTPEDRPWHREPALKQMLWMLIPGTIGLAATQINILVNSILATGEGQGAVSWLNYAFRLMQFPIGIFGVSMGAATLPLVSRLFEAGDWGGVNAALTRSLRQVFAINLPAAAGLAFLGVPIIRLIFEHGRFSPLDTQATALALAGYALGLAFYSAVKVLVPACYAMGIVRIAVFSSLFSVGVNVVLNIWLVGIIGYWGLALGTSFTAFLNCAFLLILVDRTLRRHGQPLAWAQFFIPIVLQLGVALGMGLCCQYTYYLLDLAIADAFAAKWGTLALILLRLAKVGTTIAEGLFVYWLAAYLLTKLNVPGLSDVTESVDYLIKKIKNKL